MKFTFALAASLLLSTVANATGFKILANNANRLNEFGEIQIPRGIFDGTITMWDQVEDSGLTGRIEAIILKVRDGGTPPQFVLSPSAAAFKTAVGLTQFVDVTVLTGSGGARVLAVIVAARPHAIGVNDPAQALFGGEHAIVLTDCDGDCG